MLTGMRDMMITLIFENTRCFEGQEKAGQGLCRRTLQAFTLPRSAPSGGCLRIKLCVKLRIATNTFN